MGKRGMKQCNKNPNRRGRMRSKVCNFIYAVAAVSMIRRRRDLVEKLRKDEQGVLGTGYAVRVCTYVLGLRTVHLGRQGHPFLGFSSPNDLV